MSKDVIIITSGRIDPDRSAEALWRKTLPRYWTSNQKSIWFEENEALIFKIVHDRKMPTSPDLDFQDQCQIVREAMLRSMQAYTEIDETGRRRGSLTTFLYVVGMNELTAHGRRRRAYTNDGKETSLDALKEGRDGEMAGLDNIDVSQINSLIQREDTGEELVACDELKKAMIWIIKKDLSPEERRVFIELSLKNRTQTDVGDEMDLSQAYIHHIFSRALLKLRARLKNLGFNLD